jgi:hypothetical protein
MVRSGLIRSLAGPLIATVTLVGCATAAPGSAPTDVPSPQPTVAPTVAPSPQPTAAPTVAPSPQPTAAPTAAPSPGASLSPLAVTDAEIRAADSSLLLHIDDLPANISVDAEREFGAATSFTEASLAPDEAWLAVVTTGAAHSGGWRTPIGEQDVRPAAFQFGGGLRIGPWSQDGRYVVFIEEGPAPSRTLSVVNREVLGPTVADSAVPLRAPGHNELDPDELAYEPIAWRDGQFIAEVAGTRYYRFDPATGEAEPIE